MDTLITNLEKIDFSKIDVDFLLDNRETAPFDTEWIRVYKLIDTLKKEKNYSNEIEKYNSDIILQGLFSTCLFDCIPVYLRTDKNEF